MKKNCRGQVLVIFAFTSVVIFGVLGLAIDAGAGYYVSSQTERAASNGALAAVPYMQGTLATYQAAADQAFAVAEENGFGLASFIEVDQASTMPFPPRLYCNPANTQCGGAGCNTTDRTCGSSILVQCVPVTPATTPPSCAGNKVQVSVTTVNGNFFGSLLGIKATTVKRSATAEYLPPLTLGQPGGSIGSDLSNLGTGNNQYLMRLEAWGSQRGEGDAYTPNPADPGATQFATTDTHILSTAKANEAATPANLGDRGGFNYLIYIPAGQSGHAEVYNPAFAPDAGYQAAGISLNFHEQDSYGQPSTTIANNYPLMTYTLYKVNNVFDHRLDTPLSQATFDSIIPTHGGSPLNNAGSYGGPCPDATSNCHPDGFYSVNSPAATFTLHASAPPAMFHGWVDVGRKDTAATDNAYTQFTTYAGYTSSVLSGGAAGAYYRVRVDANTYAGGNPQGASASAAHKGYAGRVVVDAAGSGSIASGAAPCTNCTFGSINDFAIYTPINGPANPSGFNIPLMQVPPQYAGKAVTLSIFDPGDMSGCPGGPFNTIKILQPNNTVGTVVQPAGAPSTSSSWVLDVGTDLNLYFTNPASVTTAQALLPSGSTSNQAAFGTISSAGANLYNGHWLTMQVQIPANYTSIINVADPTTWYWSMQYTTNCTGNDTVTVDLSYGGSPVHLIP